jgi:photosynthetic reaction center cytochrome c subunit
MRPSGSSCDTLRGILQAPGRVYCHSERTDKIPGEDQPMKAKVSIAIAAGFLLSLATVILNPMRLAAQQPSSVDMQGKTAGEFYKNVKAMKDIPAADLHPSMEYITVALGVGCGFCHDTRHFDSDDKPEKKTARNMIQMTFALNNTVFNGKREVTCYTCHRGAPIGASTTLLSDEKAPRGPSKTEVFPPTLIHDMQLDADMAPVPADASAPPARQKAGPPVQLPSVEEVFAKYKETLGAATSPDATLVEKGTVEMEIPTGPGAPPTIGHPAVEVYHKAPDKGVVVIHLPAGVSREGFDGSFAWLQTQALFREETGGEGAVVRDSAEFPAALRFQEEHSQVKVDGMEKIEGHDVYRVVGMREHAGNFDRLYFDTQSGLLLRSWTTMDSPLGAYAEETDYENYGIVNGAELASTIRVNSAEGMRVYRWDDIQINVPVDDALFAKPSGPSAAPAPPRPTGQ